MISLTPVIEVNAGREAEVDAHGTQFAGHEPADRLREAQRLAFVFVETPAEQAGGGNRVKPSRKRWTRPPSWSTAISNCGVRSARISAVSAVSCRGSR